MGKLWRQWNPKAETVANVTEIIDPKSLPASESFVSLFLRLWSLVWFQSLVSFILVPVNVVYFVVIVNRGCFVVNKL